MIQNPDQKLPDGSITLTVLRHRAAQLQKGVHELGAQIKQLTDNRVATNGALQFVTELIAEEEKRLKAEEAEKPTAVAEPAAVEAPAPVAPAIA